MSQVKNIEDFRKKYTQQITENNISVVSSVCVFCSNLDMSNPTARICRAFPKGIPLEIWKGENNHSKPYQNDNGIQFEKIEFKEVA